MSNALDLILSVLAVFGLGFGRMWLGILSAALMLWAVHLVLVQPKPGREEVGFTSQQQALLLAVPLVAIGFAGCCLAWAGQS